MYCFVGKAYLRLRRKIRAAIKFMAAEIPIPVNKPIIKSLLSFPSGFNSDAAVEEISDVVSEIRIQM